MAQDVIDDLCDARATVRTLRGELQKRRIAFHEAKDKLAKATNRLEDVLTEIEQHQGRLPFADQPEAAVPVMTNGQRRGRRRMAEART